MTFLPEQYNVPESPSGYMKFKQGANKFRILSSAVTGYEYWNKENKPVRQKGAFDLIPEDIKLDNKGLPTPIKHFWAFVVWNYESKLIQILEITQASIQRQMKTKIDNREGNATKNDFIVTRSGEGLDTEYDVDVTESSLVAPQIQAALKAKNINLEALFTGDDPFAAPSAKQPSESNLEPQVAPDIAQDAQRMEDDYPDGSDLPF